MGYQYIKKSVQKSLFISDHHQNKTQAIFRIKKTKI